jgi:hypothetical protein
MTHKGRMFRNERNFISNGCEVPAFALRASAWQARLRPSGFGVANPPSPFGGCSSNEINPRSSGGAS